MLNLNEIYNIDCLTGMAQIADKSIDMIFVDLPYQKTQNSWDVMIPFEPMWEQFERIIKDNGAILLFGQDKFTAKLMLSNEKLHRYNIVWDKVLPSGFLNAKKQPLRSHEDICVFYKSHAHTILRWLKERNAIAKVKLLVSLITKFSTTAIMVTSRSLRLRAI